MYACYVCIGYITAQAYTLYACYVCNGYITAQAYTHALWSRGTRRRGPVLRGSARRSKGHKKP